MRKAFEKIIQVEQFLKDIDSGEYSEKIERIRQIKQFLQDDYIKITKKSAELLQECYFSSSNKNNKETTKDKVQNIEDLMYVMMFHAQNGTGRSGIKISEFLKRDSEKLLKELLCGFNPQDICNKYKSSIDLWNEMQDKSKIYKYFKEDGGESGNTKNNWESFIVTVYYIAKFLERFDDINEVMELFKLQNEKIPYCLPSAISSIPGFGPAFSADFIKEVKYNDIEFNDYIKPDSHLTKFIADVFCDVQNAMQSYILCKKIADKLQWSVFQFDKIIYLYCTLDFYLDKVFQNKKLSKNQRTTRRKKIVKFVNGEINKTELN